jgi:hypothetical protein
MSVRHPNHPDAGKPEDIADDKLIRKAVKTLSPQFIQKIIADAAAVHGTGARAEDLGKVGPYKARAVDFDTILLRHGKYEMETVVGANGERYPDLVPKNTVEVDSNQQPHEYWPVLSHEAIETGLMQEGWDYDKAHSVSNWFERGIRERMQKEQQPQQPQGQAAWPLRGESANG